MAAQKNKLIITWKPEADLVNLLHNGSFPKKGKEDEFSEYGFDSFKNIKTLEAAKKVLRRRNIKNILFAKYNGEIISNRVSDKTS